MAYSDFTLKDITQRFDLKIEETQDLFPEVQEVAISGILQTMLREYLPLALAIHTEKARSELLIAPILVEVRTQLEHRISLFSGVDFNVAPEQGLNGVCDFILSQSPEQLFITAPVIVVVEAKNENIKGGLGQCVSEMVAARLFNQREGSLIQTVYGAVTTGSLWKFLRLDSERIQIDQREYHIDRIEKILGILVQIVSFNLNPVLAPA